jgi:hypothetical protein
MDVQCHERSASGEEQKAGRHRACRAPLTTLSSVTLISTFASADLTPHTTQRNKREMLAAIETSAAEQKKSPCIHIENGEVHATGTIRVIQSAITPHAAHDP